MEGLTKVLVMLYEETEKPADALEYPFLIIDQYSHRFFPDIMS